MSRMKLKNKKKNTKNPKAETFMEEITRYFKAGERAKEVALAAIEGMPLDRTALARYTDIFTRAYEKDVGLPSNCLEAEQSDYIYLFEANGFYKIGVSQDIQLRKRTLQTGNPYTINLVDFTICIAGKITEAELHQHFKHVRKSGEWFELSQLDVLTIKKWFRDGIPTSQ